ncbi:hypothetical protein K1T71_009040 [Dendrolimus kikuchii]|uniref:Uncharacterized protein n=1 Tax=Dendrolimus kikuchii TaxID=765133 RepID=A0ACC1CWB9_9NEOP|nr:hypothetical protein K1T71_009040 [Dendrolimus kikuchii]
MGKMFEEGSRSQMIQEIVYRPAELATREFTSYYREPGLQTEPKCGIISYSSNSHKNHPDISAYPTFMNSLKWNPYIETTSARNSQSDFQEPTKFSNHIKNNSKHSKELKETKYNCRCDSCNGRHCPSKLSSTTLRANIFKDNIMTFSEKFTMTPKLCDAGCGSLHIAKNKVSDVSVTASNVAVRETQIYSQCTPLPILKKPYDLKKKDTQVSVGYEPERDTFTDDIDVVKSKSIRSFFKSRKKHETPRRNVYNEGISDVVVNQRPRTVSRVASPINVKQGSKATVINHRYPEHENYIPFSHRNDSKYHDSCKSSTLDVRYNDSDDIKRLIANPQVFRRTYTNKPLKYYRSPPIKLPRKVLTSEQDIDSYIDKKYISKRK